MDIKKTGLTGGLMALAAAVIIFWGVRSLAFILAPLAMAMVITIAIMPFPGWLTKKGVKPGLALILTILAVVGVLALIAFITIGSIGKLAGLLPSYAANCRRRPQRSSRPRRSASALAALIGSSVPVTATDHPGLHGGDVNCGHRIVSALAGLNLSVYLNGQPIAGGWAGDRDRRSRGQGRGADVPGALHLRLHAECSLFAPG